MKRVLPIILTLSMLLCGCGAPAAGEDGGKSISQQVNSTNQETAAPTETNAPTETAAPAETAGTEPAFPAQPYLGVTFTTVDVDGNPVDETLLAGHRLVMLNFWEPWCGPCVGELPDLQRLSQDYAAKGVLIVGVYSDESGAKERLTTAGVTYPVIVYTDAFRGFLTDYVPTTVFLGPDGLQVGETQIGSRGYAEWADLLDSLL